MNPLFGAAADVQELCVERGWRFCFIGGLAVLRWGEPRLTRDVDLTILAPPGADVEIVDGLLGRFEARLEDARAFALENRVVLVQSNDGTPIDIALGALDFEARTVSRASPWDVGEAELRTCSAEDLVVHKVFAGREQDWLDVAGVVVRQGDALDRALVVDELGPLLDAKGTADSLDRLQTLFREASGAPP
ncbi:MAG TPA: nucleotidyl transferase AbiEii/AbiGii toxin family protein [Gaiellaceae bacterium]|nr:nucleotidyl transferase AbiEii/AbiGii toxin family protein [Gaiellaceae bacterium]